MLIASEGDVSSFRDFFSLFQSLAAEKWKETRPKEELATGVTSEINPLACVLLVGAAMVTSELRYGGALPS